MATLPGMRMKQVQEVRRKRLKDAADRLGSNAALGRLLGHQSGVFVGQMLRGERPVTEDTVLRLEAKHGFRGWFSEPAGSLVPTPDEEEQLSDRDLEVIRAFRDLPTGEKDELERYVIARARSERQARRTPPSSTAVPDDRAVTKRTSKRLKG
jgi:hypothetical protein